MRTARRRLSRLEWQLPLSVVILLVVVVGAFSWAAYREVRHIAIRAAGERLEEVSQQLASLLSQSLTARLAETRRLAADSAVVAAVDRPDATTMAAARQALAPLVYSSSQVRTVTLWDRRGARLLAVDDTLASPDTVAAGVDAFPAWAGDSVRVSALMASDEVVWYQIAGPVRRADGALLGYLVQHRRLTSSPQGGQAISDLIGMDASFMIGQPGGLWTDLARPVTGPALDPITTGASVDYWTADGRRMLGAARPIAGSPWLVWLEFPESLVLRQARAVLGRIAPLALMVVLLGALGGWGVSRRITGRLGQVEAAALALARGESARRVGLTGNDEPAALGRAFNTMADSLEAAVATARSSEELFRYLFANNPLPMWVYELESLRLLEVNDAACEHYGYTRAEFLTLRLTDIRPTEDVPRLMADLAAERPELARSGQWRHQLKDGRIIAVEIASHRLVFDGRPAVLVVATDITERLEAERLVLAANAELEQRVAERTAELQASVTQFRTLTAAAHDAIVAADSSGDITFFNAAAERLFGWKSDEMVGQSLTMLIPPRFHEAHRRGLARYVVSGQARIVGSMVELHGIRADGTEFPLELSLAAWTHDGAPAFVGILRDITDRKQTEAALRRYAADLEVANRELEAFSYSVSHDLRAPLRSVHGFSQAVLEDYRDRLDDQGADYLRRVCAAAEHMGQLIDDLLELSKAARVEMRRERIDLSRLVHQVTADLAATEPDRTVAWRIQDAVVAEGDQRLLTVVLRNLLGNAWKFSGRQGAAQIEFGVAPAGEGAYFVRDNGAGFDMAYADKLFQPFQRLHTVRDFSGTGIGLALVQRIIHRHGGRVWAEGAVDQGATFYFTLPPA